MFCCCRSSAPALGHEILELPELSQEVDKKMNPDTLYLHQIVEGIKHAAHSELQAELKNAPKSNVVKRDSVDQSKGITHSVECCKFAISNPSPGALHDSGPVLLKDYLPELFHQIRKLSDICTKAYIKSWDFEAQDIPKPKLGAGRSGSLFMFSKDKRFLFKTIPFHEVHTLLTILPKYAEHVKNNPNSRLMRFFGLHRFRSQNAYTYVVVTNNIFFSTAGLKLNLKFDLKGRVPKHEGPKDAAEGGIWKDNQLKRKFYPVKYKTLIATLEKDADFLRSHLCIDYSLLIGVHTITKAQQRQAREAKEKSIDAEEEGEDKKEQKTSGLFSGVSNQAGDEVYFIGIIDFLSRYFLKKKTANFFKNFLWNDETLSTVPPKYYCDRWKNYLPTVLVEDTRLKQEAPEKESKQSEGGGVFTA